MSHPQNMQARYTVQQRLEQYGAGADKRWAPFFHGADVAYPGRELLWVVIKAELVVQVYARNNDNEEWCFIRSYPVQAASGRLGPKLREGDLQVPEGIYKIQSLNPNSRYHLSLRINYPNGADRRLGSEDGREHLGGDIMIHGRAMSMGCLAMGDEAAEDFFVLAGRGALPRITVLMCPVDFRRRELPPWFRRRTDLPSWVSERYADLSKALGKVPLPFPDQDNTGRLEGQLGSVVGGQARFQEDQKRL